MAKQYNINIVGDLTNTDGVLSGFSANSYATFKAFAPGVNPYEVVFKFKYDNSTTEQMIWYCGLNSASYGALSLRIWNDKFYVFYMKNNSAGWDFTGSTTLQTDTDYWVKLAFDGNNQYYLYLSTDGVTYSSEGSKTTSEKLGDTNTTISQIGLGAGSSYPFQSTIDLNESYIKMNGLMYWQGTQTITHIQLRHDTAANWTSVNPILLEGEVGIETDTNKTKIGDGTTAWNSLAYNSVDLSNYYTKTEVDTELEKKQDTLTATLPLRVYNYTPDFTYTGYTIDASNNLTKDNSDEHYIVMPYNKNYLYKGYFQASGNNDSNIRLSLGKFDNNGTFLIIAYANLQEFYVRPTDNSEAYTQVASYAATGGDYNIGNSNTTFLQCYIDGSRVRINTPYVFNGAVQSCNADFTVSNEIASRLAEITHVIYENNSTTYPDIPAMVQGQTSIGYYDVEGFCNDLGKSAASRILLDNDTSHPNLFRYIAKGESFWRIEVKPATTSTPGVVQPDGETITVNSVGTISVDTSVIASKSDLPDLTNYALKSEIPTNNIQLTNGAGYITSSALSGYQTTANLVTSLSASSTDTQYPSAKCVYDLIGDIETLLQGV